MSFVQFWREKNMCEAKDAICYIKSVVLPFKNPAQLSSEMLNTLNFIAVRALDSDKCYFVHLNCISVFQSAQN